jgi:Fe2+ or Zn2+ uptake regulation protein
MPVPGRLETYLYRRHISLTRARHDVFMVMGGPISAAAVVELTGLPRSTVFKTIKLFVKIEVAYESQPGIYELTDLFAPHRHYKVCKSCGRRLAFNSPALERALAREDHREQELGFVVEGHTLEFTGVCGLCRSTAFPHNRK